MLERSLKQRLAALLGQFPVVGILGPRQVGKTSLALQFVAQKPAAAVYVDLQTPQDRLHVLDSDAFWQRSRGKLVVLDEVQCLPGLFAQLRGEVDRRRRAGQRAGQFLVLGSASMELLKQSSESLAGRIVYTELRPLHVQEVTRDVALAQQHLTTRRLWLRGGFPDSFLAPDGRQSQRWRQAFMATYLQRDIPALGPRVPAATLRRLWTMLAYEQGEMLRLEKLAGALALSGQTVRRYIDLLIDLLLVRRLSPWLGYSPKRLVKTPKIYCRDSGLVHALLNLTTLEEVLRHPIAGHSWEGFVLENLLAVLPEDTEAAFYRTAAGAEIDLVLDVPGGKRWAIEIKRATNPRLTRGFYQACEQVQPHEQCIVHGGEVSLLNADGLAALTLSDAMQRLRA